MWKQIINEQTPNGGAVPPKIPGGPIVLEPHPLATDIILDSSFVTDATVDFVADPFIVYENGKYHMFFEILESTSGLGKLSHAWSPDGIHWTYNKIILEDDDHWSYPQVFKDNGTWYMIPERGGMGAKGLSLFRATSFPDVWELDTQIFPAGKNYIDSTLVIWKGKYYLFTYGNTGGTAVSIYYSDTLNSTNWTAHPMNPVWSGVNLRGGGRPIIYDDCIDLFIQDGRDGLYGEKILLYRVTDLSPTTFEYTIQPELVIGPRNNGQWNSTTMHQVDIIFPHDQSLPIAVVDGEGGGKSWRIGIYTIAQKTSPVMFRAWKSSDQSLSSGWANLAFNNVTVDTRKSYDKTNYKYTIPESGYYEFNVNAVINVTAGAPANIALSLFINGVEKRYSPYYIANNVRQSIQLQDFDIFKKGDVLEFKVTNSTSATAVVQGLNNLSWINVKKVDIL